MSDVVLYSSERATALAIAEHTQHYLSRPSLQGYLAHKKTPPPLCPPHHPRHTSTVLEGCVFLCEVPLYTFHEQELLGRVLAINGAGSLLLLLLLLLLLQHSAAFPTAHGASPNLTPHSSSPERQQRNDLQI